jgi:hypothetical protein
MNKNNKTITTILLFAIFLILITAIIIQILKYFGIIDNIITDYETFEGKRYLMKKIYKNNDIADPDEDPDDEGDDPDSQYGADPDSQYNSIN